MTDASDARRLRAFVIASGVATVALFVVVGLAFDLQTYGDGSIFSYAVAVQDSWAFHWRNISARAAVYLLNVRPGELVVGLTGSPRAGVFAYGLLSFSAQSVGLAATFALDRTPARRIFVFACASTAILCPLSFGFPTEALITHALFWPTFAAAHRLASKPSFRAGLAMTGVVFALMLALVFTHEAALGLAFGIVGSLALLDWRDPGFWRTAFCLVVIAALWFAVDRAFPPDAYFAEVRVRAASEFFQRKLFASPLLTLIGVALAAYGISFAALTRLGVRRAHVVAALAVVCGLAVWWLRFDSALHADNRYYLRTILLLGICVFAAICAFFVLRDRGARITRLSVISNLLAALVRPAAMRAITGALALALLVHTVETIKFLRGWRDYRGAILALAQGEAADREPGDRAFVSSARIAPPLDRLAWFSTTPYLSALVADFSPSRLVVDPAGNYFWISCATARASVGTPGAVPRKTRELVEAYACAHPR